MVTSQIDAQTADHRILRRRAKWPEAAPSRAFPSCPGRAGNFAIRNTPNGYPMETSTDPVARLNLQRHELLAPLLALTVATIPAWWAFPDGPVGWHSLSVATAWAGVGLVVASLILMVREPRFAALLGGLDRMYTWHHRSGVLGYVLLLLHPLALAMAAWQVQPAHAWQALTPPLPLGRETWTIAVGWLALLAMMPGLAVTFAPTVAYRRWRAFHFMLGLAVIIGLVHVLFVTGYGVWAWALLVLALVAFGWRLAVSDRGVSALPYRVATVDSPMPGVIEATLEPLSTRMAIKPGQFVLARFLDSERYRACGEFHPFSVSAIEPDGRIKVTIKALGACTWRIQQITAAVLVRLQGPFGRFLGECSVAPQLWVAGGIGITPFIAALRARPCNRPVTLIYLFRTINGAVFLDELQAIQRADPNFQLLFHATGVRLPDFDLVLREIDGLADREVHICGPAPLATTLVSRLHAFGVPTRALHYESFDFR